MTTIDLKKYDPPSNEMTSKPSMVSFCKGCSPLLLHDLIKHGLMSIKFIALVCTETLVICNNTESVNTVSYTHLTLPTKRIV